MQLGGLPQCGPRHLRVGARGRQALELTRGLAPVALFHVGHGKLAAHFGLQRVLGVALAEVFERACCAVPVFQGDQRGSRVELRRGAHRRQRGHHRHAVEVAHGVAQLAGGPGLLTLFVDRGRQALDQLVAASFLFGRQGQHFDVGPFCPLERAAVEGGVGHHRPGHTPLRGGGRRVECQHLLGHSGGTLVAQGKEFFGGVGEHRARAGVGREGLGKTQCALDTGALQLGHLRRLCGLFQRGVAQQRGVAGIGAPGMHRVLIGGFFVLDRGFAEALVFVQQLGQQEVVLRCLGVIREGAQVGAVPLHRLLVVAAQLALLRECMVVAGQLGHVGLDQRLRSLPALGIGLAELALHTVA